MNDQQRRVIEENPNLSAGKLADFLGLSVNTVKYHKKNKSNWFYYGVGLPFCCFDIINCQWSVVKNHRRIVKTSSLDKAIKVVDHLIWCIENNMFNQPRIEHPYLENLKFGE